jgi:hypothetical protein
LTSVLCVFATTSILAKSALVYIIFWFWFRLRIGIITKRLSGWEEMSIIRDLFRSLGIVSLSSLHKHIALGSPRGSPTVSKNPVVGA